MVIRPEFGEWEEQEVITFGCAWVLASAGSIFGVGAALV